ncbi:MAG: cyclase/dehydrase [Firmicutes bacterium]|nr:cyclase/dehydrase [Bacillota bacterium]
MPCVETSMLIKRDQETIYAFIKDMEQYPRFMTNLVSVEVLERTETTTITKWKSKVDGIEINWKELDTFDHDNFHVVYHQLEGDLKNFDGEWLLSQVDDSVYVTLKVNFEFGIPMLAPMINPLLKRKVYHNSMEMLLMMQKELCKMVD